MQFFNIILFLILLYTLYKLFNIYKIEYFYDNLIENNWPIAEHQTGILLEKFNWLYNDKDVNTNTSPTTSSNSDGDNTAFDRNQIVNKIGKVVPQDKKLIPIGVVFDKESVFEDKKKIMKHVSCWRIKYWKFRDSKKFEYPPIPNRESYTNEQTEFEKEIFIPLPDFNIIQKQRGSESFNFIGQSNTGKTSIQKIWMFFMQMFLDVNRYKTFFYINSTKNDIPFEDFCEMSEIQMYSYDTKLAQSAFFEYDFGRINDVCVLFDDITGERTRSKLLKFMSHFTSNKASQRISLFLSLQTAQQTGTFALFKTAESHTVYTATNKSFRRDLESILFRKSDRDQFIPKDWIEPIKDNMHNLNINLDTLISTVFYPDSDIVCSQRIFNTKSSNYSSKNLRNHYN